MVSASLAQYTQSKGAKTIVAWFPDLTIILLVWILAPFVTMALSSLSYTIVKRTILIKNSRIRSLVVTPYISGAVFLIYFAFVFSTKQFKEIKQMWVRG